MSGKPDPPEEIVVASVLADHYDADNEYHDIVAIGVIGALKRAGYVIVPTAPTDAMLGCGIDVLDPWDFPYFHEGHAEAIWLGMIEAAGK